MKNWKNAAIFQKSILGTFPHFCWSMQFEGKLLPNKYFYKKHNVEIAKETNGLAYFCTKEKYSCSIKHSHTLLFFTRGAPFKSRALARKSRPVCRSCAFSRRNPVLCAFPFFDSYHHGRSCSYPGKQQPSSSWKVPLAALTFGLLRRVVSKVEKRSRRHANLQSQENKQRQLRVWQYLYWDCVL